MEDTKKITVLLVEPDKYPKVIEIEDSLEAMQELVGGDIEEYMPFNDDVALVCNGDGKMSGMPLNRAIYAENDSPEKGQSREIVDIIAGKFFIAHAPLGSENFKSLPKEFINKYKQKFKYPEHFLMINNKIAAVPFKPKTKVTER